MSIRVNITRINRALITNNPGLTLAVLTNVITKSGVELPIRINNRTELHNAVEPVVGDKVGIYQLQAAERLLDLGTNLVIVNTVTNSVLEDAFDEYDYKMIIAPYTFVKLDEEDDLTTEVVTLVNFVENPRITAQLFLDLDPEDPTDYTTTIAKLKAIPGAKLAKLDLCVNSGIVNMTTELAIPELGVDGYFGVPASVELVARKAMLLLNNEPWIAVAGETNGAVPGMTRLYNKYNNAAKEALQSKNINVLMNKPGFGPLFVSQNTQFINPAGNPTEPLLRSHVVTEALWIKRELKRLAAPIEFMPNNARYQTELETSIRKFLRVLFDNGGLEQPAYTKVTGTGTSMTGVVEYIPIKATESIILNVAIVDNTGEVDIMLDGGNL